jgi:hypothetical protein
MMPATTIDVSAGTNIDALNRFLTRSLPILELITAASTSGTGMSSSRVSTMYRALLNMACQNTRSFHRRS